jgi:hypothetical protein
VIFCLFLISAIAVPLIYFDTAVGKKIANFSACQLIVLVAGLCVAFQNLFVQSRIERFEAKQRQTKSERNQKKETTKSGTA